MNRNYFISHYDWVTMGNWAQMEYWLAHTEPCSEGEEAADDTQEILDKIWRTVALFGTAWLVFVAIVGGILISGSA